LRAIGDLVGSGDPDNIEARAAREYWSRLFEDFTRAEESDLRNKLLNYGYAVVRAAVARALVASGCLPALGLHHESAANAFNLADDIFEPFRPFVDALAFERAAGRDKSDQLTIEDRRAMAGILMRDCRVAGEIVSLLVATERAAESLVQAMEGRSAALLKLPELLAAKETPP
jgi:CRISPR-associated protein Cas1